MVSAQRVFTASFMLASLLAVGCAPEASNCDGSDAASRPECFDGPTYDTQVKPDKQPKPCKNGKTKNCVPDPQVPIDHRSVGWVSMIYEDQYSNTGVIGYVLVSGSEVSIIDDEVSTDKGVFSVSAGIEHWYSPSNTAAQIDLAAGGRLYWHVSSVKVNDDDGEIPEGIAALQDYIDASSGLVDAPEEPQVPSLMGEPGVVHWKNDTLPTSVTSFQYNLGLEEWHLSIEQGSANELQQVVWSTNNSPGRYSLPSVFANNGVEGSSFIPLLYTSSPDVKSTYEAYE